MSERRWYFNPRELTVQRLTLDTTDAITWTPPNPAAAAPCVPVGRWLCAHTALDWGQVRSISPVKYVEVCPRCGQPIRVVLYGASET